MNEQPNLALEARVSLLNGEVSCRRLGMDSY